MAVSGAPAFAQTAAPTRVDVESRYQIGQMERVLEGAVEHGVTILRDRMQNVTQMPMDLMVSDNAHARGFRLDGYGVFFDVIAPSFETSVLVWSYQTLGQNDLGVDSALKRLQAGIKGNADLEQALKRLQIVLGPSQLARLSSPQIAGTREATGSAASSSVDTPQPPDAASDPILNDPNEVYHTEVTAALKNAMLDHTASLNIGPTEWLTIAVKGNDIRPRLAPADTNGRTVILRLRGADLAAFVTRQIERAEALKRIEVLVF
ncbi:MAG TPA: hypothetical protein VGY57_16220 [Vicinamibacterales bacterium]|nr:hypothetical protein [Vicinamibacterales bacterium]